METNKKSQLTNTMAASDYLLSRSKTSENKDWLQSSSQILINSGGAVLRYGLVGILLYYGFFKFTAEEAAAIEPLVRNSPLMSWLFQILSVQGVSNLLGTSEIIIAILILTRPVLPVASAIGSLGAVGMFLTTLSFLFTTPGAWVGLDSFPLPVATETGGFLIKDVFLLGAALYTAGEALAAAAEPKKKNALPLESR